MSIVICERCGSVINSDDDPDCFVEKPNYQNTAQPVRPAFPARTDWWVWCARCRDQMAEEEDRRRADESSSPNG